MSARPGGSGPTIAYNDPMKARTLRGAVAVAGIGETAYYKRGQSPDAEFKLALQAILRAAQDAVVHVRPLAARKQDQRATEQSGHRRSSGTGMKSLT